MGTGITRFFSMVMTAAMLGMGRQSRGAESPEAAALVKGNTAFALELYGRIKESGGNTFFSPYSISTCLGMTYSGARGDTAGQMAQVLRFTTNQMQVNAAFGEMQRSLNEAQQEKGMELNVANGLWKQEGHPFLPAFLDVVKASYEAEVREVDFRRRAEPTRQEINGWVDKKTKGKITDLIPPGMLDASTRLVLVNAIYFKGLWLHPFNKTNTTSMPFSVAKDKTTPVPMMRQTADFRYVEATDWQLLELPYASNRLAMTIVLPKDAGGLKALEDSLNPQQLDQWLDGAAEQKVSVFLPRFKLTAQFELGKTLAEMGMKDAFTSHADFSGMDGARDLAISDVVHKAYVDVNEEGTEAAAATAVGMRATAVMRPRPVPVFRADHPFLFLIRDVRTGGILFLGRVTNPGL